MVEPTYAADLTPSGINDALGGQLRGPVVGLLDGVFRERWDDPTPIENKASPLGWLRVGARSQQFGRGWSRRSRPAMALMSAWLAVACVTPHRL